MSGSRFDLVAFALWFGLVTGIAEVLLLGGRRFVLGRFNNVGVAVIWMAPLVDVVLFGVIGGAFYALARLTGVDRALKPAVGMYTFVAVVTVLMMYYPLHWLARIMLAAGIAVQFAMFATRRSDFVLGAMLRTLAWPSSLWRSLRARLRPGAGAAAAPMRLARRDFLLGTGATLGALAAGLHGREHAREWYGVRRLPPARAGAPNVLFIVLDTVRSASLSVYGYEKDTTPELTRLARQGVVFRRAYSHSPWTLPSHGAMFTGRYPHELSGSWETALDGSHPVLAEVLAEAGYVTGGFVANTSYCSYESGLHRGFLHFEDYAIGIGEMLNSSTVMRAVWESETLARRRHFEVLGRKDAAAVNRQLLSWLSGRHRRPFFAFVNYFDAHTPYLPPPPFQRKFAATLERPNVRHDETGWQWTADQRLAEQAAYDAAIAYLDHQVGELMGALDRRGLLDNTLVVVTSDHGELFGEYGLMGHANNVYAPVLQVPLLVQWRGRIPENVAVTHPVGLRHLASTVLDLAGIAAHPLKGASLAPSWGGTGRAPETWRPEPVFSSLERGIRVEPQWRNADANVYSLIVDRHQYIRDSHDAEELYDLAGGDPGGSVNLAAESDLSSYREAVAHVLRNGSGHDGGRSAR